VEDLLDAEDPVTECAPDIFNSWKEAELRFPVEINYMDKQMEINKKMRAILVDWLVDVHISFRLHPKTLYLAIQLIDRYLQKSQVPRNKLQLVGVTCMSIAAKFEDAGAPCLRDLSSITDNAYQPHEIANYEVHVLGSLDFKVLTPVALEFLLFFQKANQCSDGHSNLTQYILELSLCSMELVGYTPSHLAAASVLLSNKLLKVSPSWSKAMVCYTGYESKFLTPCAKTLCGLLDSSLSSKLQATRKKFSRPSHGHVARIVDSLVQR
jgi:cyclin B